MILKKITKHLKVYHYKSFLVRLAGMTEGINKCQILFYFRDRSVFCWGFRLRTAEIASLIPRTNTGVYIKHFNSILKKHIAVFLREYRQNGQIFNNLVSQVRVEPDTELARYPDSGRISG